MALHLRIENETTLPDGGPVSITVTGKRGIDIGRDAHLDWTLPDPTRYISSKHAEIRFREGGYWLHDVSTNGTLLNGGDHRMQAPHRLRNGDHFSIGHYIIAVALDGDEASAVTPVPAAPQASLQDIWDSGPDVAPPIDRSHLKAPRDRPAPVNPDFLDWAADVPGADPFDAPPTGRRTTSPRREEDMSWAVGPMSVGPPPPQPPPDLPSPRRRRPTTEPDGPPYAPSSEQSAVDRVLADIANIVPSRRATREGTKPDAKIGSEAQTHEMFLRRLAQAAGVPQETFVGRDAGELAVQLGAILRITVDNLMQLLKARQQAKVLARSSSHTMIQAVDNNPLKFAPSVDDARRIMFGPGNRSYLDGPRAAEQGFEDLKRHQIKTYSAMQHALTALIGELDPQCIDRDTAADGAIAALVTSRKAKLWDAYLDRWQTHVRSEGAGLIDNFMLLFAEYYDRDGT